MIPKTIVKTSNIQLLTDKFAPVSSNTPKYLNLNTIWYNFLILFTTIPSNLISLRFIFISNLFSDGTLLYVVLGQEIWEIKLCNFHSGETFLLKV